jgi:hypothetical protein
MMMMMMIIIKNNNHSNPQLSGGGGGELTNESRGFEFASSHLLVKHYTTALAQ